MDGYIARNVGDGGAVVSRDLLDCDLLEWTCWLGRRLLRGLIPNECRQRQKREAASEVPARAALDDLRSRVSVADVGSHGAGLGAVARKLGNGGWGAGRGQAGQDMLRKNGFGMGGHLQLFGEAGGDERKLVAAGRVFPAVRQIVFEWRLDGPRASGGEVLFCAAFGGAQLPVAFRHRPTLERMQKAFEAPTMLRPLALADAQRVQVIIADLDSDVAAYFDAAEWESSKHDDISLHEVRTALASIEGSLADAAIASREERF